MLRSVLGEVCTWVKDGGGNLELCDYDPNTLPRGWHKVGATGHLLNAWEQLKPTDVLEGS
jgi:hypothetical protein